VRWIVIATVLALSPMGGNASESATVASSSADSAFAPVSDHSVAVESIKALNPDQGVGSGKKLARSKRLPKSLLSRTERHRLALLVDAPKSAEPMLSRSLNDEDADGGAGDLDLQSSFGRPKVIKKADRNDEDNDQIFSDAVRLRLFLARMKALKVHEKKFS